MRTHTGEKPYKCHQCSYSCATASDLKNMGELIPPTYKCDQCQYSCAQKQNLKTHRYTHTGEKPYKCVECSYRCTTAYSLERHIYTHK